MQQAASASSEVSWVRRAPLLVPVVLVVVTGSIHRIVIDDGFIYFRVVQNVMAGNGPVFNSGERVEAYTSPAWLGLLSLGDLVLPFRLEWIAVVMGLLLSVTGMVAAMAGALRLARRPGTDDPRAVAFPAGALVFAAPFGVWVWHTAGMENGLVFAWLGGCLFVLARWADERRPLGLAEQVLVGLGWLVRPELVLFSAAFVVVVLVGDRADQTRLQGLRTLAGMVALPAAYQILRMGYFGSLVANTALVKEGTSVRWNRGATYLRDFVDPYLLWFPLAVIALGGYLPMIRGADARRRAVVAAFVGSGLATGLWVVAVGGDYLHARLLVPAFFALCAPIAAVPLQRRYVGLLLIVPWAVAAVFLLRPPQLGTGPLLGHAFIAEPTGNVTADDWRSGLAGIPEDGELADTLHLESSAFVIAPVPARFEVSDEIPTPAITASGIGAVSYILGPDVHVIDTLGLAHPIVSRFESNPPDIGLPGHDKAVPVAWLAAEVAAPGGRLEPVMFGLTGTSQTPGGTDPDFADEVAAARRALACEPLVRVRESTRGDFGPRRFLRNLVDSPANTFVRIPMEPTRAVEALC